MLKNDVALKKLGTSKNVSDAVLFLSSEKSDFTTGRILVVDGGQLKGL